MANRPAQDDLRVASVEAVVAVVEDDLDVGRHDRGARALVEEGLALLASELGVGIAEDEADRGEEVTLPRPVATDDNVRPGREGLDDGLILVAGRWVSLRSAARGDASLIVPFEALDDDLLDIHGELSWPPGGSARRDTSRYVEKRRARRGFHDAHGWWGWSSTWFVIGFNFGPGTEAHRRVRTQLGARFNCYGAPRSVAGTRRSARASLSTPPSHPPPIG